ncbi:radical SAM protein [bacterium]|nr:radical SAM protein [bacterium]
MGNEDTLDRLNELYRYCTLCPRGCGVDRTAGEMGSCGVGPLPLVTSAGPHYGEEPELVGRGGSGTIFFGGCNLHCLFCQNADISQNATGRPTEPEELALLMLNLERMGCENVNLVTPTHFAPPLARAIGLARGMGLRVPVVWNCGGYESLEVIELLDGIVEIYMPDFKYGPQAPAGELSQAPDYFEKCSEVLGEMHRQVGALRTNDRGVARKGVLIRHLVLPNNLADSRNVLRFIAEELSTDTYVNIMAQYHPHHRAAEYQGVNRRPTSAELNDAWEYARSLGLHRGF